MQKERTQRHKLRKLDRCYEKKNREEGGKGRKKAQKIKERGQHEKKREK